MRPPRSAWGHAGGTCRQHGAKGAAASQALATAGMPGGGGTRAGGRDAERAWIGEGVTSRAGIVCNGGRYYLLPITATP